MTKEAFNRKRSIFCRPLEKELKTRLVKYFVWSVALYGAETLTLRRSEEKRLEAFEICETWTVTLRKEQRLRVFENKVLRKIFGAKRGEVTGGWRKLHNTELHALYYSPDIIRNIKSRRLRWAGHVARMGESRNAYRVLVGRPEGKRPLGRPRRRWEDNIKIDLREVGYDDREWINLAQDRDRCRAYVRATINLRLKSVFVDNDDDDDDDDDDKMWIWRRMERVKWTDRVTIEALLERVGEEKMILKLISKRKRNWLGHWLRINYLLKDALEGMVNGRRVRGRRICQIIDDIKIYGSYAETKMKVENRKDCRMLGYSERPTLGQKTKNE
ncbi:hypothetical protein ANN_12820 [Periplaneta americana]|uniref:Endonuclease-reverse transcriptase n=1 Tax=Periplaneta americana TaxID=6978 RepID=A0ABQ8THM0_PERAM|nr:hypothetical protein ANN_12820 [Periplaneta americana]